MSHNNAGFCPAALLPDPSFRRSPAEAWSHPSKARSRCWPRGRSTGRIETPAPWKRGADQNTRGQDRTGQGKRPLMRAQRKACASNRSFRSAWRAMHALKTCTGGFRPSAYTPKKAWAHATTTLKQTTRLTLTGTQTIRKSGIPVAWLLCVVKVLGRCWWWTALLAGAGAGPG